ncbi:MAG: hypothetical protein JWN34_5600, partial [Bryobacterales bacterium]|nr:hypothetical protein [Bryobacterales bacterium]
MLRPLSGFLFTSVAALAATVSPTFDESVKPLLTGTCVACHNDKNSSGGLSVSGFLTPGSIASKRDGWELIVRKVRAGEMPPKGMTAPPAQVEAMLKHLDGEFARIDRNTKPDPGRLTAHRLNRTEYSNTVRDLLGVSFQADEEFPADDSAYGFDNVGDVLTVSPTLMQKYLSAAEQIASRAVGADPLPKPGVVVKKDRLRRLEATTVQMKDRIEYDADYIIRVNLVGHRGAKDKPVNLQISVDGKPIKTVEVPVQISAVNQQGGATQRSSWEQKVFLPAGDHVFRSEFLNDEEGKALPREARLNTNRNIYPDAIEIAGPFPSAEQHPSQKKVLICDPAVGVTCVNRILSSLTRKAYRRPVTAADVSPLLGIFNKAKTSGYNPAQSLQFSIAAMLVSPNFLFRIEKDPKPGTVAQVSDLELASRLSYFLWSSMPDDELLRLAEQNR